MEIVKAPAGERRVQKIQERTARCMGRKQLQPPRNAVHRKRPRRNAERLYPDEVERRAEDHVPRQEHIEKRGKMYRKVRKLHVAFQRRHGSSRPRHALEHLREQTEIKGVGQERRVPD